MRASSIAFGLLLSAACGKGEPAPPPARVEAPGAEKVEEPVAAPTRPTPAFMPAHEGSCTGAYRLVADSCVHRGYHPGSEPALQVALEAYKRGAAPPMLGAPLLAAQPEPAPERRPDPGSLMRRSSADAGSAKQQRISELDAMLAAAREKLAIRDAESKAKKVENAPRATRGAQVDAGDRAGLDRFAQGLGGPAAASGALPGSGDSADTRMSELSRLTGQLSGEQLQALTTELGKSGFNADALEAILSEARSGEEKPH
jgi:hypothetical protein